MALDYIQGLARVGAVEMSDARTASLCAHGY